ncbi:MAG: beta-N-acetylhexosaminidase, partial [Anaerolineaceae bacterium]|nr:beta-N-acetylhexosaminidase [Anaerolineaceae bacterium]
KFVTGTGVFEIKPDTCIFVTPGAKKVGQYLQGLLSVPIEITETGECLPGSILVTTSGADPTLGDEGYQMSVTPQGVTLRAPKPAGLFYAVKSLHQLLPASGELWLPVVEIEDQPRFRWRGVMLDVGRHMFPLEFIYCLIDVMALHKMNVLHWHLTEDQGWRIEIQNYPRLTEVGAWRSASPIPAERKTLDNTPYGGFYNQEQIKQVIAYAARRFITVVPEIEMPGHAMGALTSYPELGCTGGPYQVRTFWGIEEDVFCAGNEEVYGFLENVLDEVMELFPSEYIHIGGDECPKVRWEKCPKCQAAMEKNGLKNEHELQSYFIRRIEAYLNSKGRRLIGWDEILEGGLAPNASVMSWRGIEGGIQAAKEGHDVVMTPNTYCYLDYYQSEDHSTEPPAIGGYLPLEKVYSFNPVPPGFTAEEAAHILGGQANLWTEYIPNEEQTGYMLFPRASALAEVLWSGTEGRDYADFLARLEGLLPRLKQMGINYRSL